MFLEPGGRQAGYSVWGESGFLSARSPIPTWRMGRVRRQRRGGNEKGQAQGQGLEREGEEGENDKAGQEREGRRSCPTVKGVTGLLERANERLFLACL